MRDIPFFTTEYGVAGISLKEIPYRATAYVTIRTAADPKRLLEECIGFCTAAGADVVLATGHPSVESYPLEAAVLQMRADPETVGQTYAAVFPVQEKTLDHWRQIYNSRMADVPLAAYLTKSDAAEMVRKGQGYFVHRNGQLLGIGAVDANVILNVISVEPGAGKDVLQALVSINTDETVELEVASTNERALRLYKDCGFIPVAERIKWYRVK